MTGRPRSSVNRIVKAFSTEARLTNLPRGHRPKVTTDSDGERIVEAARRNPKMTAKEIRNDLGLVASTQVVRERLHVGGLRSRVAAMKPFVSSENRIRRLLFAQEHRSWTVEEWQNVIFTDESTFASRWDQQQRTWRTQGTRFDAPNLHRVASSGRCSVNVWGSISKDGLGPLVRLDGLFRAAAYTDLLDTILIPYALNGPFKDGLFFFQHDRSPVDTAASVKRLLEDRCVMVLDWPPQGADMNIIENVRAEMKKALSRRPLHKCSSDILWAAVEEEWQKLARSCVAHSLYESLPRRMAAVLAARGETTKY
ncbi:hypothetical protein HPB52_017190 [Rhipicephalus sanguineus]|uniref:Transposable element Tc1 transposase n=1 Tax=Rhipicephalus sanguineus TaxID=34632 RepID=A0A9D4PK40_RHISA|nr:hypothetical protein HPB52_017190 [Rhipicephalus sanguineus]